VQNIKTTTAAIAAPLRTPTLGLLERFEDTNYWTHDFCDIFILLTNSFDSEEIAFYNNVAYIICLVIITRIYIVVYF